MLRRRLVSITGGAVETQRHIHDSLTMTAKSPSCASADSPPQSCVASAREALPLAARASLNAWMSRAWTPKAVAQRARTARKSPPLVSTKALTSMCTRTRCAESVIVTDGTHAKRGPAGA